ncbi:uncharacterized protein [Argopecten irradians]|uniref:uncharacterized protein n=1 Tax=Argopecten irradians TaxID=31199 RepID=UPI0037171A8B
MIKKKLQWRIFLPNGKLDSPQEMGTFSAKFESTESRKGLVRWLASLQGGEDIGLICRTTMRAFMTNKLMSFYSVKGQKGKLPFNKTTAYSIVLKSVKRACRGKVSLSDVMLEVGDVLRNAPNKPGGINYIKKQHQNKQNKEFERTTEMEGDDSDASISD